MKPYHKNPRQITKKKFERLNDTLARLGDLGGIVHNLETDEIIGGNQRMQVFQDGKVEIADTLPEPDDQGTIAQGFIVWKGHRFAYRQVRWDEKTAAEANIAANIGAGDWDWDVIANEWSFPDLVAWGMSEDVLRDWKRDVTALDMMLKSEQGEPVDAEPRRTLAVKFGVPPFSILDARQGYWQARKRAWIALGIQSELGRGENLQGLSESNDIDRYSKKEYFDQKLGTLGAIAPNENGINGILTRTGKYAVDKKNGLLGESEQSRTHYKNSPGGSPRDAATLGADGKIVRGDGRGRELAISYQSQSRLTALQKTGDSRAVVYGTAGNISEQSGTSIFDPVLCELAYRWFMPQGGGKILDPFGGGSVRGIVASILDKDYTGIDLSERQIEANRIQAKELTPNKQPIWIVGDSQNAKDLASGDYDFIFSCPPYGDLEVYSDDPADLSTMGFKDFITVYRRIISVCVSMLKNDRFACFVVGDYRDKKGFYRNFPSETISAFQDAGMILYNEAILVTSVGSLPIRVGRPFEAYRKLGKTHQNVLIFYKGNPKAIKDWGSPEFGFVTELAEPGTLK